MQTKDTSYQRRKEYFQAWDKNRYKKKRKYDLRYRAMILNNGAKRRAKKLGIEHSLDIEWVHQKLLLGTCEASGLPFQYNYEYVEHGYGVQKSFSPSLDRINPAKGYTKDNVQVVVWCYNAAKGCGLHEDVLQLAEALHAKYVH